MTESAPRPAGEGLSDAERYAQGMKARREVLSDAEILRVLDVAVRQLGITKIRFTGGEPLLRRSLEQIVAGAKQLRTRTGGSPVSSSTGRARA